MMQINHTQAKALARFINAIRNDWGVEGITTALGQARNQADLETLARWAIRAALDTSNRTPAIIAMPGAHREPPTSGTPRRDWPDDAHRCRTCSLHRDECRRRWHDDHPFEPATSVDRLPGEQIAAVVAELRDHKAAEPPPRPEPPTSTAGTDRVAPVRAAIAARTETEESQP